MQNRKRDTDVQNRLLDSVGEGEGGMFWGNSIETCILSRVKQITSPGWMHETSARAWCTGKTQRDRVEREVGGGNTSGWGTHVNPWLIHVNVWQKPLQYCKVISLQLIKINGKKITVMGKKSMPRKRFNHHSWITDKRKQLGVTWWAHTPQDERQNVTMDGYEKHYRTHKAIHSGVIATHVITAWGTQLFLIFALFPNYTETVSSHQQQHVWRIKQHLAHS